jgi:hypothetical protein
MLPCQNVEWHLMLQLSQIVAAFYVAILKACDAMSEAMQSELPMRHVWLGSAKLRSGTRTRAANQCEPQVLNMHRMHFVSNESSTMPSAMAHSLFASLHIAYY